MIRSLLFAVQMYVAMGVLGLIFLPAALVSRDGALRACKLWCRWVRWTARWMIGLRTEVRGAPPEGPVLVAAKHQSFLDVILIFAALPRPRFILKAQLLRLPVFGWYVRRLGCIPVEPGRKGEGTARMVGAVGRNPGGQIVIYPQGTRVPVGRTVPYRQGVAALYAHLDQPCVPVATNAGRFWPLGLRRHPGLTVVEFLDPIPPGLPPESFLAELQARIEASSSALLDADHDPHRHA
ncbi:lysophospholipid acyltransferase family protein [Falsirhodobacter sp. 20TX0035]|uniref:lysophospholipid acyltransferase family protein n=1 Tax=Falsirhodobacter sp. 20TX0035 TaxID=3022019 RepID=UPI0023301FD5|nr:lysophospholipid acyltransferase family protein [Falsirhodobacter sp. 20TX0035]MDB6452451.1 lysophospholipid acyltransferase family protein [Falsirhodobacter sp. 20TX0035]